jgi:hypothetical protein
VCAATALPHCGHLVSCGACQRLAAFRVRNRIFDVLRFGTPMAGGYESTIRSKDNWPPEVFSYKSCKVKRVTGRLRCPL